MPAPADSTDIERLMSLALANASALEMDEYLLSCEMLRRAGVPEHRLRSGAEWQRAKFRSAAARRGWETRRKPKPAQGR